MERGETPRNTPIFHGWWIVLVAFICHAVNTGMIFYAWGVFFRPLAEAFGGHAPVATGFSALQFAAAGYSLLVGRAVDRHGARPVEIVGALVLAVGFLMLSRVHSLAALYLCLAGPVALGSTCIGPLKTYAGPGQTWEGQCQRILVRSRNRQADKGWEARGAVVD